MFQQIQFELKEFELLFQTFWNKFTNNNNNKKKKEITKKNITSLNNVLTWSNVNNVDEPKFVAFIIR